MIELHNLTVGYGTKAILSDINQVLKAGQLVCLLGANGVGKSTILRTLAGFQPPLWGEVLIDGRNLSSLTLAERSKAVSVVLTERVEVPYMKVVDLVGMGYQPVLRDPAQNERQADREEHRRLARDRRGPVFCCGLRLRSLYERARSKRKMIRKELP